MSKDADDDVNDEIKWTDTKDGLSFKQMRYEKRRSMVTKMKDKKARNFSEDDFEDYSVR